MIERDEELDKATARLELGLLQGMETCSGKAEHIGLLEVVLGEARDVHVQLEAWRAVSAEQLRELALRLLRPERRTVILVMPQPEDGEARDGQAPDVGEGAST